MSYPTDFKEIRERAGYTNDEDVRKRKYPTSKAFARKSARKSGRHASIWRPATGLSTSTG
jgi:hypothetical protein